MDLRDPVTAASLVAEALERAGVPHALYGGLLLAAYGRARETSDADMAVADADLPSIRSALDAAGIEVLPVFDGVAFGGLTIDRFTLLRGRSTTGLNTLDIVRPRSARYRVEAIGRAVVSPLREWKVRVLTPEDFVLFKVLSTRETDLEDAASVLTGCHGLLDREFIRSEAGRLAVETPDHDVRGRLSRVEDLAGRPWV